MATQFFSHLNDDLEQNESYNIVEGEMAKYKTLNHETIKWEEVYNHSLIILQNVSMDIKICNYFVLSCIVLNNTESLETMSKLFEFLSNILQDSPNNLCKNPNDLANKKKQLKNTIEHFIAESNKLNIPHLMATSLNYSFNLLGKILECHFKEILIPKPAKTTENTIEKTAIPHTNNANLHSLNDREYRTYFLDLAYYFLENNTENLNAYAMFIEAMWGKIKTLPTHINNTTQIRFPDENLIKIFIDSSDDTIENIKYFMSNLALNPFWIEGLKIFCEFLEKNKKTNASKLLHILAKDFLATFKDITNLKFANGESICKKDIYEYFLKQNKDSAHIKPKAKTKQAHIDEILLDINAQNHNNSSFNSVNALLKMARIFDEKNMPNNAKILYKQLKNIMETMLLKDYLQDDYLDIKAKIEKK